MPNTMSLHFFFEKAGDKNNQRIISKPHVNLKTMAKTSVKFQRNRHKTVGGVAHTRYPLSIHFDSKTPKNDYR